MDDGTRESVEWKTHRTLLGLFPFILIGLLAGMFGLGAGWANVPVLNLLMGVPQKVSVATSKFLLTGQGDDKLREATQALNSHYFEKEEMGKFWGFIRKTL